MKRIVLFIALIFVSSVACANSFSAMLDRDTVYVGETFHLVLTLDAQDDQRSPDLSGLKRDFTLQNMTKSIQVASVNGQSQERTQWALALVAKRDGVLTLPSIALENVKTQAVALTVKPVSALPHSVQGKNVFIDVSVSPAKEAYVESQLFYSVKLYYHVSANLMNPSLVPPSVEGADMRQIPGDRRYQVTREGERYGVVEARYVIFPKTPGPLTIQPPVFSATQIDHQASNAAPSSLLDLMNAKRQSLHVSADTLHVNVLPRSASQKGCWWLPATKVTLKERWSKQPVSFRVGEPITRTLTLTGESVLSTALPEVAQEPIEGVSAYKDQPVLKDVVRDNRIVSSRVEKIALVPSKAGSVTLPEIRVPWWNVNTRKADVTVIPAKTVTVLPALHGSGRATGPLTPQAPIEAPPVKPESLAHNLWTYLAALFCVLWLLTLFLWWYLSRNQSAKVLLNTIKRACEANNPQAVKTALLGWGRCMWPYDNPTSIGRIAKLLNDDTFYSVASDLDAVLYQGDKKEWQGAHFWTVFRACAMRKKCHRKQVDNTLPPLY